MARPSLDPAIERRIARMLLAGLPGKETARIAGVSESVVSSIRRSLPAVVRPAPAVAMPPRRPAQVGSYFDAGLGHEVRVIAPAWASGDLEVDYDSSDQEE